MAEPKYVLHADESPLAKVPWWAWVAGFVVLLVLLTRRRRHEFEDYLS